MVQASTPTHNRYWRPPWEGKQPEVSLSEWDRFVKKKQKKTKHEAATTINFIPFRCAWVCVFECVYVCSVLVPVTNSNSVSSLKTTQALLAIPLTLSESGMEIIIYHITGKKETWTERQAGKQAPRERRRLWLRWQQLPTWQRTENDGNLAD